MQALVSTRLGLKSGEDLYCRREIEGFVKPGFGNRKCASLDAVQEKILFSVAECQEMQKLLIIYGSRESCSSSG